VVLLLNRRDEGRLLIFCYVRCTTTSRDTQCLKGGAHVEMLRPWNRVTRAKGAEVKGYLRGQDDEAR
jgi:hypothetical protein